MTLVYGIALCLLLLGSAFCSSSETVFFSLDPIRLRRLTERHPHGGARVHALLAQPTRLLSTILVLNTAINVSAAMIAFRLTVRLMGEHHAEEVAIVVFTFILLIFGEYGPKHVGLRFTERLALSYAVPLNLLAIALTPLRWGLERITRGLERFFRPAGTKLSNEELATALHVGEREGLIDEEEFSMIQAIIGLEKKNAADVMRPRTELIGLDLNADPRSFPDIVRRARRRHLLLYRDMLENVEGFLDCRKYLLDPEHRIEAARLPAYYIPENLPLNRLLLQFQKERRRIAVVVDEYGSVSGLVTRGDILEEISGEVYQELSRPRPVFMESGPGRWIVDASLPLDDLNERLHLKLSADDADLLSGWVAYHAGHVPAENESVEAQSIRVTVLKAERSRVTLVQLERLPTEDTP
jgi:putative hemolysin